MGSRVLVTGAGSGIGRAVALRLLASGSEVVAVDRAEESLRDAVAAGATGVVADLATGQGLDAAIAAGGGVDGLVNSAGIMRLKPILDFDVQDIRETYAVNFEAVWMLTSHIGRTMPEGSAIVNLSSLSARFAANVETAVYASSKAAVLSLTRSFAHAFAPRGVRVNAVLPGIIDTAMQSRVVQDVARLRGVGREQLEKERLAAVPLGRAATPEECAGLICFLLSEDSAYITGQGIGQDGGMFMV